MQYSSTPENLPETLSASLIDLAKAHRLDKLILFGSRARGNHRPRSDVDLAVSGGDLDRFSQDVEEKTPTLLMFDVVGLDQGVTPELLAEIERDGILLYEKDR